MLFLANSCLQNLCVSRCKQNFLKLIIKNTSHSKPKQLRCFFIIPTLEAASTGKCSETVFTGPQVTVNVLVKTWPFGMTNSCTYLICVFDFLFQVISCSLHLFLLKKSNLFSNSHFCYILQSQAVMIFIHKTETFLCYDGSLKEVGTGNLSF